MRRLTYLFGIGDPIKQGLTTDNAEEQAAILRSLLEMQCGNGLMHESVSVDKPSTCTRPIFEWANEMLGTALIQHYVVIIRNQVIHVKFCEQPSGSPAHI
jgi:meiotically up-regulated gene 157 (Mug157) protein